MAHGIRTCGVRAALLALLLPNSLGAAERRVPDAEKAKIDAAIPAEAPAKPRRPRRLLVFDLNVGYPGHGSIAHANYAIARMGEKTGAYEAVIDRRIEAFEPENLRRFDAVFLNNTVGNPFDDPRLRESLRAFLYAGGGLLGYHGSSITFQAWPGARETWPEFARILGARGCTHRQPDERVWVKNEGPEHPINAPFGGKDFEFVDEVFRYTEPYSRDHVRVLLSVDTAKTDMNQGQSFGPTVRPDGDYALAWVREYGRGRIFYSAFGHHPRVFWDPRILRHWLAAIQFALGDLDAGTTPSAKLTLAARARERLGWRLAVAFPRAQAASFADAVDRASALGVRYIGIPDQKLEPDLSGDAFAAIRRKLYDADVHPLTYALEAAPAGEAEWDALFASCRKMGIDALIARPPDSLDRIAAFSDRDRIRVAIRPIGSGSPDPKALRDALKGRSPRLGVCADPNAWVDAGIDPLAALEILKDRVIAVRIDDPGAGAKGFLARAHALGVRPLIIEIAGAEDPAKAIAFIDGVARALSSSDR
ncbi:MAG: ThuA domain-containing protein [Planctomycetes bacterium]|nr:ThuA domain-containing protein [Planctomycetota bacterium]